MEFLDTKSVWSVKKYKAGNELFNGSILSISERSWANNGDFVIYKHRIIYAVREKNERGVGLILDQYMKKHVLEYYQLPDRILVVKLRSLLTYLLLLYMH